MSDIDEKEVTALVLEAGRRISQGDGNTDITVKGRADFVTRTDIQVQEFLTEKLRERYPDIGMFGEEQTRSSGDSASSEVMSRDDDLPDEQPLSGAGNQKERWILDPIDGTTNYIYGYRHSAISLGLCNTSGSLLFGVVYNPYTEELFSAAKGKGAYLNGNPIHVNTTERLSDALIGVGTSPYYKDLSGDIFDKIHRLYQGSLDIRRSGSAALDLAYVACGRLDAYFEYRLKPWDYAAGLLLIREAGGYISEISGEISFEKPSDVAVGCSMGLLNEVLAVVRREDGNYPKA